MPTTRSATAPSARALPSALLLTVLLAAIGCSSGAGAGRDPALGFIGTEVGEGGAEVEKLDVNGDSRPDVWRHFRTLKAEGGAVKAERILVRKDIDLNFDGQVDIRIHLDRTGVVTKEEFDLDFDGRIDMIAEYEEGTLRRQAMDEGFDGSVDVWRHFEQGALVRKERDVDGDGRIDVWEYFEGGKLLRIGRDIDRDGKPELFEEVAAEESGAVSSPAAAPDESGDEGAAEGGDDGAADEPPAEAPPADEGEAPSE